MNPVAPALAALLLSLAATAGVVLLHQVVQARGADEPLNRRFMFGLRVTALLYAGRALAAVTGVGLFDALVLIAASLIPLAVLILTEGLLRRHAPVWVKLVVLVGTAGCLMLAVLPAGLVEPWRSHGLMGFQLGLFGIVAWLVLGRDRAGLTSAENLAVGRLGLSLVLLTPFGALDFLGEGWGLPVQPSALAVLVLCRLALSLGRSDAAGGVRHGGAVVSLLILLALALAVTAVLALATGAGMGMAALILALLLAALLLADLIAAARADRDGAGQSLLDLLVAGPPTRTAFLAALQAHPAVQGAALLDTGLLADLDPAVLTALFAAHPVLRRADPWPSGAAARDHVQHLFARHDATHLLLVGMAPPAILALAMPTLAASARAEQELRAVARLARHLPEAAPDAD